MSLTKNDIDNLRVVIREEVRSIVTTELEPIHTKLNSMDGRLTALENDIKDIYAMISDLQHRVITDKNFQERTIEEKVYTIYAEIRAIAKQNDIILPTK